DEMRGERDREERDRCVTELARAVRRERGDRDDREQQHQRSAHTSSVAMSMSASQTPARSSNSAKTPDAAVADPARARKDAAAIGTGSAALTTASSRALSVVSSGRNTRTVRAATTSHVATTARTASAVAPATITGELAIAVMYERCGGIQKASDTAASPPPARTTSAPARAVGEPVASATKSAASTTS